MIHLAVPDLSCNHCKTSVEAALAPLSNAVQVDLTLRRVSVDGGDVQQMFKALEAIGFPATVIAA